MPAAYRLTGGIAVDPVKGSRLPESLHADSGWFTGKGRTVGVALKPWAQADLPRDSTPPGRRAFGFDVSYDSLGPGGIEWLQALDQRPRYQGAMRVRLVWGKDTAYVDASACPMDFSM
jgi:hypothetical protein